MTFLKGFFSFTTLLLLIATQAFAATIAVDTVIDELTVNGVCSLREAITNANDNATTYPECAAGNGADTIVVPAGTYFLSLTGTGDDANLNGDLDAIDGAGITIQGAGQSMTIIDGRPNAVFTPTDRVFHAAVGGVTIDGVTIQNGNAIYDGGGLLTNNTVTITNSTISGNKGPDIGGGVFANDAVTITNSTISGNTVNAGPGINDRRGGGVYANDTLTITNSTISDNTAGTLGGGVFCTSVIISDSDISGNTAGSNGGGVYAFSETKISNSTISGNTAGSFGGGVYVYYRVIITNSTISSNTAGSDGGGISVNGGEIINSTISGNTKRGILHYFDPLTITNSIVTNNTFSDCGYYRIIISGGHNIDSDGSCKFVDPTDLPNTDPLLGLLQDNGGPTFTHALLAGSPAFNAGDNATCAAAPVSGVDQRGMARPQGTTCDIGAFEVEFVSSDRSDFNGDGKPDLVWRNSVTGQNIIWHMDGVTRLSGDWLTTVANTSWQIAATGDFNGDGRPDLVWRNYATGANVVWYMDGATRLSFESILTVADTNWEIVGSDDFNGDGKPDLVWRNFITGQNIIWNMDGVTRLSGDWLTTVANISWKIVGTGDFNSDGKPDLVWRNNSTGQNVVWYMDGATRLSYESLLTVADTNWEIVGSGDFNSDGKPDLVWRNYATGQNVAWYMDGATKLSHDWLPTVADPNWKVVN